MGCTYWVYLERDGEVEGIQEDHTLICKLDPELNRTARELHITPLTNFSDGSLSAADFADEFEGIDDLPSPKPEWYDSTDGLKTVESLLDHLSKNPELFTFPGDSTRSHYRAGLMEELEHCRSVLMGAVANKRRFHLAVIM